MSEADEWLDELVTVWVEVYKTSMTTLVLLRIVADLAPVPAATIRTELAARNGWQLTERGLYRTLKRLAGSDLLPVERTGRPRKDYALTDLGGASSPASRRAPPRPIHQKVDPKANLSRDVATPPSAMGWMS